MQEETAPREEDWIDEKILRTLRGYEDACGRRGARCVEQLSIRH